jgi:hypothetical protein
MKVVEFVAPGDTGLIISPHFAAGRSPLEIVDMTTFETVTTMFKTGVSSAHGIRQQSDTGFAAIADHVCWAIIGDTGVAALT